MHGLLRRKVLGAFTRSHLPDGDQAVPVREELLDIGEGKIADRCGREITAQSRWPSVPDDATGDDDPALRIVAAKGFDQPRHTTTQVEIAHFIHAVEEHYRLTCRQASIEEIVRDV